MENWSISLDRAEIGEFSPPGHTILTVDRFLQDPDFAIEAASLQKFAKITPQYPGLRSPLAKQAVDQWLEALSPLLSETFAMPSGRWQMQGWNSLVTSAPEQLLPIQRLPHVDGTDPDQIAMMLYLHRTDHGGTAFFRHKSTGLEVLTAQTFPQYKAALESEVARVGMPPAAYVTDGAPLFERTHQTTGAFNQAVFYRGNILHSGVISRDADLSADPRRGRFTINAFLRPPRG